MILTVRMRPRFELGVSLNRDAAYERIKQRLDEEVVPWHVALLNEQIEISPHNRDLHFWSPYLKVRLEEDEAGHTTLRGVFGPNINLWTFLLAIYAVCGLLGVTGLLVAYSQWFLGQTMTGLALTAVCALISALVWGASQLGQRFAQDQMQGIHDFIINTYDDVLLDDQSDVT